MPPTLKDGSALPTASERPERASENAAGSEGITSTQPVALEVQVTVNGARAVEGSEKREPFSETTNTVLVLANGAVIRLSSSVAPGQLLFLTNEKTKKEVVCQVVKSKNYRSLSGYVELEFTEPVLGFWGMRFPGDRQTGHASAAPVLPKSDSAFNGTGLGKSAEPKPSSYTDASPAAASVTSNLADAVQEFKAEIKADARPTSKADFLAPAETSIDGLKLEANRLQEQLSALLFAEQKETNPAASVTPPSKQELGEAAAKILDMTKQDPATSKLEEPAKSDLNASAQSAPRNAESAKKSSFDDEESKIPAWLEPLARNAAVHAPPTEEGASDSHDQFEEWQPPTAPEPVSSQKKAAAPAKSVTSTPKYTPATPLFGNSLFGESAPEVRRRSGGGKGIWIGIAAGLIAAAAGGAWYFRDPLASLVPAHSTLQSNTSTALSAPAASPAARAVNASAATPSLPSAATAESSSGTKASAVNAVAETPARAASNLTQGKMQAAAITERILKPNSNNDANKVPENSVEVVELEIKKPSLGAVRLAKPKMRHSASVQANGETEPELELNNETLSSGNSLSTNFSESSKQPAAPAAVVPVGGDVKPAHLISSVPPTYPALAKTQHVAGDVRVDALVDVTGRVTTMKVVSGPSLLHQAAIDALRQWKYQAATLDGKAVPMHLTVTIQFRLQ
jgi:TonB family protein